MIEYILILFQSRFFRGINTLSEPNKVFNSPIQSVYQVKDYVRKFRFNQDLSSSSILNVANCIGFNVIQPHELSCNLFKINFDAANINNIEH